MTEIALTSETHATPLQMEFKDFVEQKLARDGVYTSLVHEAQSRVQQYGLRPDVSDAAPFNGVVLRDFQDGRESFVAIDLLRGKERLISIAVHDEQWEVLGKDQVPLGGVDPEPLAENLFGIVQTLDETGTLILSA